MRTSVFSVEFVSEEEGRTRGLFVADAESYGIDRLWVLLEPIPIDCDASSSCSDPPEDESD